MLGNNLDDVSTFTTDEKLLFPKKKINQCQTFSQNKSMGTVEFTISRNYLLVRMVINGI